MLHLVKYLRAAATSARSRLGFLTCACRRTPRACAPSVSSRRWRPFDLDVELDDAVGRSEEHGLPTRSQSCHELGSYFGSVSASGSVASPTPLGTVPDGTGIDTFDNFCDSLTPTLVQLYEGLTPDIQDQASMAMGGHGGMVAAAAAAARHQPLRPTPTRLPRSVGIGPSSGGFRPAAGGFRPHRTGEAARPVEPRPMVTAAATESTGTGVATGGGRWGGAAGGRGGGPLCENRFTCAAQRAQNGPAPSPPDEGWATFWNKTLGEKCKFCWDGERNTKSQTKKKHFVSAGHKSCEQCHHGVATECGAKLRILRARASFG